MEKKKEWVVAFQQLKGTMYNNTDESHRLLSERSQEQKYISYIHNRIYIGTNSGGIFLGLNKSFFFFKEKNDPEVSGW